MDAKIETQLKKGVKKKRPKIRARTRYSSRLTSKNQITIPKEIRKQLYLEKGDIIIYELFPDNTVILRKTLPLDVMYLKAINTTLNEWESEEDEKAYKPLIT